MVSTPIGRAMGTLLGARPKKLQDAISRIDSTSRAGSLDVSVEQSLLFLHKYIKDAAEEESLDQILVPIIEHSIKRKESRHVSQTMILLNWIFQDEFLFEAIAKNLASIILRKDDHYITFGWCTLVRGLVEYEITTEKFMTNGIMEKYSALLQIFASCIPHLLSVVCHGSTLQGGFELPTRLSVAAADCILAITLALTKRDLASGNFGDEPKLSNGNAVGLQITSRHATSSEKKVKTTSTSDVLNNMEMKLLLWDHLDDLIILVQRLVAWNKKSRYLHAKGSERVFEWLQSTKGHYACVQNEAGSQMLNTGALLLSSCWKHYGMLLHLEDYRFSQHYKEWIDQYLSGIQLYRDNFGEEHAEDKDSGMETMKFFLNCLSLLLGHLDGKQFEGAMTEYRVQISRVLLPQLRCADEDVIDAIVGILKTVIFKNGYSLARSSLHNTRQIDSVLQLLLNLLDEQDGTARVAVMLVAEYCSKTLDSQCLQEVIERLTSGNVTQRRNAVDVISEVIHKSPDLIYCRQDIANNLLERLRDEELVIQAQASSLIPMMDPSLVLPALVHLVYSPDQRVESSASNTLIAVLRYHKQKFEVACILIDCLSNIFQNPDLLNASSKDVEGSKLDTDRVFKLIPKWSKDVDNWNELIGPLIDKMFAEPSNAIVVRFLSCISEHLADAADVVFHQLLLHTRGQKEIGEGFLSRLGSKTCTTDDHMRLQCCLFDRLCPLLIVKLLPLRIFDNLSSSIVYGELINQQTLRDNGHVDLDDVKCVAVLLLNRALNRLEFEDVRKLAAELCGRIHPQVLFPIIASQLERATNAQDLLKIKACLFSICTSFVLRGKDSALHPAMVKLREATETILTWPSLDGDEVSRAQHGCIDCLALMICTEMQASGSFKDSSLDKISTTGKNNCVGDAASRNSVLASVIYKLTHDNSESVSSSKLGNANWTYEGLAHLPFRICMANVLISACQKISEPYKKLFALKILPHVINSLGVLVISEIRAACIQVLFSSVYHLKSAVVPYATDLLKVSLSSLREGSEKERIAGAKLMASLMASEESIVEGISGGLPEAKMVLSSVSISDPSPEVQEICKKLVLCLT